MVTSLVPLAAAVLHVSSDPERILEVGCGDGDGVLFLAREFPSARVRGFDRSEERVHAAIARIGLDPEGRIAFKAGDPSTLPYPDDFFDIAIHSAGSPRPRELARVLRPGGYLILARWPPEGLAPVLGTRWLRHRLSRLGFEELESGMADETGYRVSRFGGRSKNAPSI